MKAIQADPKSIKQIFDSVYLIPDYQRPYSWETEECEKLWEDIIDFHARKSKDDKYFLGNIVLYGENDKSVVIDGQQRLTSLFILIKALYTRAGTAKVLEECLKVKDRITSEITSELRITSLVIDEDRIGLHSIVFDETRGPNNSRFEKNYNYFISKIDEWRKSEDTRTSSNGFNDLIETILYSVVLLPIQCDSLNDALLIFETINNRGMVLTDADIFKAKLYQYSGPNNLQVVSKWRELDNHDWFFRVLMHLYRAKDNNTGKESAMRTFFTENQNQRLRDWSEVLKDLSFINDFSKWEPSDDIVSLWEIMENHPNYYWKFPLYVYAYKHKKLNENSLVVSSDALDGFLILLKAIVKYFIIKGFVHNSVGKVRDNTFKICAAIYQDDPNAVKNFIDDITDDEIRQFNEKINGDISGRYFDEIVLLASFLDEDQNKKDFLDFIDRKYHKEHILPKKWNHYDGGWTKDLHEEVLNTLGNVIPLERSLNISAKNEFFSRKQEFYKNSRINDAKRLMNYSKWTPEERSNFQTLRVNRILDFIKTHN